MSQAEQEREEWKGLLGELVLQFASIESLVLDVLNADGEDCSAGENRFKNRARSAIAKVGRSEAKSKIRKELIDALDVAIDLAAQRNAYVHNPLYERLEWILEQTEEVHQVSPPNRNRPLTIKNLRRDVEKTKNCAEILYVLVAAYDYEVRGGAFN